MIKEHHRLFLSFGGFLLCCFIASPCFGQTVLIYPMGAAAEGAEAATADMKTVRKPITYLNQQKQALISGFTEQLNSLSSSIQDAQKNIQDSVMGQVDEYKDKINDKITDKVGKAEAWVDEKEKAADSWMEDKANSAGDWISDQFSGSGGAGSGFSIDDSTKKGVKGAFTAMSKVAAPVATIASGNWGVGSMQLGKTLFLGKTNSTDKLSSYDAISVQQNVKQYIDDAATTTIGDATKIINASAKYTEKDGTASTANKEANKATTIREDITNATEMGISMNVMTNILLSMDITDLSIQSSLIYEELNNMKNMTVRAMGFGGRS